MKNLLKIAAILLIAGIILSAAGIFWAHKDGVTPNSIYGVIEENLKLTESNVDYVPPEKFDFGSIKNMAEKGSFESELNDFNTLELYSKGCKVDISVTDTDKIAATCKGCQLDAGITGGTLHIQSTGSDNNSELKIAVPDSYKGGCIIKSDSSEITLDPIESAMDMSFNLKNTLLSCKSLSADNIDIMTSVSTFKADSMTALDSLRIDGESSEFAVKKLAAKSTGFTVNSTAAELPDIGGSITADCRMSSLTLGFPKLSGNIDLEAYGTSADIKLPESRDLTIRHSESYGIFKDKTNHAQNAQSKTGDGYTMETNIKFGIVTAAN